MFQECPICKGEGTITVSNTVSYTKKSCPTCEGTRIISTLTGLPPVVSEKKETLDKCSADCVCDGSCHPKEWMGMYNGDDFSRFIEKLLKA